MNTRKKSILRSLDRFIPVLCALHIITASLSSLLAVPVSADQQTTITSGTEAPDTENNIATDITTTDVTDPAMDLVTATVDVNAEKIPISKYIFGIADDGNITLDALKEFSASLIFQSGTRMSTYNWETNSSNAGKDAFFTNDRYLATPGAPNSPAQAADRLVTLANSVRPGSPLATFLTLQMAGYVAADGNGPLLDGQEAPSERWINVFANKPDSAGPLLVKPDLTDDAVYMEEYLNFLVKRYGNSLSSTSIHGYALDFQPDLWHKQQRFAYTKQVTPTELLRKSINLARTVKNIDTNAITFGGQFSGISGWVSLNNSTEWNKLDDDYNTFAGYFLQNMKQASDESGRRLLDSLDVHYLSEAKTSDCIYNVSLCNSPHHSSCNTARMQATRTLWDPSYDEDSLVSTRFPQYLPVIPTLQAEINTMFPDTQLSISRYTFGGGAHISGGLAQIDALGIFAKNKVFLAGLLPDKNNQYQQSAMRLYTNYDDKGSHFGDTLVGANTSETEFTRIYASTNDADSTSDKYTITIIVTNLQETNPKLLDLSVNGVTLDDSTVDVYRFDQESPEIVHVDPSETSLKNNKISMNMPPLSANLFVISTDRNIPASSVSAESVQTSSHVDVTNGENISAQTSYDNSTNISANLTTSPVLTVSTTTNVEQSDLEIIVSSSAGETLLSNEISNQSDHLDEQSSNSIDNMSGEDIPIILKAVVILFSSASFVGIGYLFFSGSKTKW